MNKYEKNIYSNQTKVFTVYRQASLIYQLKYRHYSCMPF